MADNFDILSAVRINKLVQGLYDPRLLPQPLTWNARIPDVPAMDDEIMARFTGTLLIADLIADDAAAPVREYGRVQTYSNKVPNIKLGIGMGQSQISLYNKLKQNLAGADEQNVFTQWENRVAQAVRYGVEARKEALKIAMLTDGLDHNSLGIVMNGVTWGMPSDLKATSSTSWSNHGSATPVTDINTIRDIAQQRYGIVYDRITMSGAALRHMVQCTEFQNYAKAVQLNVLLGAPAATSPNNSVASLVTIANAVLNMAGEGITIETNDGRISAQQNNGAVVSHRFWPINKVALTSSSNDGNSSAYDFANGQVIESIVSELANIPGGTIPGGFGPIGYATLANGQLNPPGIIYWSVARGFPRKHLTQASACLTVGDFVEPVSTDVP